MLQGGKAGKAKARRLRAARTLPERLLWAHLRQKPGGLKFRQQHPSGPYVADFYCHELRLIVEIDGIVHDMAGRPARDAARDAWFATRGLQVIRIPASQVLADPAAVAQSLAALPALPVATSPEGGASLGVI